MPIYIRRKLSKMKLKNNLLTILTLLFVISLIFIYINNNFVFVWFDEAYTLNLIKHSYTDIWNYTAGDVHPPMYYYLLKLYLSIFGYQISNARFFSAIPIILMVLVGCTFIRKLWGNKTAIFFIFFLILTPTTQYMNGEIRMYSWAALFTLLTSIFAYISYIKRSKPYMFLFLVSSLLAAYTHYYALLAIFYIYALYLYVLILKARKEIPFFLCISVLFVLFFLPWLINLYEQIKTVSNDFWITDIDIRGTFKMLFPIGYFRYVCIFFILCFLTMFLLIFKNKEYRKIFYSATCFWLLFLVPITTGVIVSLILRPVFMPRYICCFIGFYYLGFALLFSAFTSAKKYNWLITLIPLSLITFIGTISYKGSMEARSRFSKNQENIKTFVCQNLNDQTAFLYRDSYFFPIVQYTALFKNNTHISKKDSIDWNNDAVINMIPNLKHVYSYESIEQEYTNFYILEYNPFSMKGFMEDRDNYEEALRHFDITRQGDFDGVMVYELKRKDKIK